MSNKKSKKNGEDKKERFVLVTNQMPKPVYDFLFKLTKSKSLTPVVTDIIAAYIQQEKENNQHSKELAELKQLLEVGLSDIKKQINDIQVVEKADSPKQNQEIGSSIVEDFTAPDEVIGQIEEDLEADY